MSYRIMKKIALVSLMSSLSFSSFIYAGAMGDASCAPSAFGSVEGGYTYNKIDGVDFTFGTTTLSTTKNQDQLSVRLAAGVINMFDDDFGVTGELGWGYYGRTTFDLPAVSIAAPVNATSQYTLSGFDVLIGTAYVQTYYTLSFKVGGLIQNMQQKNTFTFNDTAGLLGGPALYTFTGKHNSAAVLPALKLGGGYNIDQNWSITGSWLFAFGATTGTTFNITPAAITNLSVDVNTQNPMQNSFMIGIQYSA
jgi:hypothetical protein